MNGVTSLNGFLLQRQFDVAIGRRDGGRVAGDFRLKRLILLGGKDLIRRIETNEFAKPKNFILIKNDQYINTYGGYKNMRKCLFESGLNQILLHIARLETCVPKPRRRIEGMRFCISSHRIGG